MRQQFKKAIDGIKNSTEKQELLLFLEGEEISVFFERKAVKNINLRLRRDGSFSLSAPNKMPSSVICSFLERAEPFLCRAREKWRDRQAERVVLCAREGERVPLLGDEVTIERRAGRKNSCELVGDRLVLKLRDPLDETAAQRTLKRFLDGYAKAFLSAEVARIAPLFGRETPTLSFRAMKGKWGVCRPRENRVTLNLKLVFVPRELAEYVIFHEMAHFRYDDHSPSFWRWLEQFMPDYKQRRRALNAASIPEFEG